MAWSEPDKAVVKSMWEGGSHASEIAALFHTTRSAICGLCDRQGWESPHKQGTRAGSTVPKLTKRERTRTTRMRIAGPNYIREMQVEEIEFTPRPSTEAFDAQIPVEQRKALLHLNGRDCHWPCGDPRDDGFFFCGVVSLDDKPYCAFHWRAAHVPHSSRAGEFALAKWKTTARSGW